MDMLEIILAKRYGQELNKKQIAFFVDGVTHKNIPDYQISSLLMAIVLQGMTDKEMTELTMQMAHSGEICDLSRIPGTKVDKHSSGGVGDKCTMIVLPMVAACGVPVVKLSGRGLGFTGGTIDKLESIQGFQTSIPISQFVEQIQKAGMVVSGQTPELAPADKILYALRDVTGTVDSIPLIASSIMSKKIAGGADAIVLNVTCGAGAFMKDEASARALSLAMIQIGHIAGRPVTCVISSMDQPLGRAVGNTLEVMEAFDVLSGKGSPDVIEVCTTLAAAMLQRSDAGKTLSYLEAYSKVGEVLEDGTAIEVFSRFVTAQGGSVDRDGRPICIDMPQVCSSVYAQEQGYISHVDARSIGEASMLLGAGRRTKDDVIDPGAGITLEKKVGSYVEIGEKIADLYLGQTAVNRSDAIREAKELVASSVSISPEPVQEPVEIIAILDEKSL